MLSFTQSGGKGGQGSSDSSSDDQLRESRGMVTQPPVHRKAVPRDKGDTAWVSEGQGIR